MCTEQGLDEIKYGIMVCRCTLQSLALTLIFANHQERKSVSLSFLDWLYVSAAEPSSIKGIAVVENCS